MIWWFVEVGPEYVVSLLYWVLQDFAHPDSFVQLFLNILAFFIEWMRSPVLYLIGPPRNKVVFNFVQAKEFTKPVER
jgi:hypothetical protein